MNIRSLARKPFFDFFYLNPLMPQMLRIALSDSLTYSSTLDNSGPHAHFNFSKFRKLKVNSGLNKAFKTIKEIKEEGNHITERLSTADLIQIGGASAIEYCGGPYIELKVGRSDIEDEHFAADSTAFPELDMNANDIRIKYNKLGFSDEMIVALFGHRTLGFVSNKDDNKEDRWTRNPWVFDNNYYEEILDKESTYAKTPSDLALVNDDKFRHVAESFARDQQLFFDAFIHTYQKMSELGSNKLLEENLGYLNIHI
jgi:catalase (peroxidase I)